ncbi:MAG: hypothetical protein ACT4OJ_08585 [Bacteroidota bacterium]
MQKNHQLLFLKLKPLIVSVLLLGFAYATLTGAYNYAKYRIQLRREKIKKEQLAAYGFDADGIADDLRLKMLRSTALTIAGGLGIFIFINRATRANKHYQTKKS